MSIKPSRHQAREVALQILYRFDGAQPQLIPTPEVAQTGPIKPVNPAPLKSAAQLANDLINELNYHFDHFNVPTELRGFAAELVAGTLRDLATLDGILEKHASNWKIGRMGIVDRNLLRMSIHELSHFPDTPTSVVIDEAIELAKQFGTAESPAFVNGVLDAIKSVVRKAS